MTRAVFATLTILLATGCGDATIPIDEDATIVTIVDNAFISNHIQVFPNQQVVWRWTGNNQHSVTFDTTGVTSSATMSSGEISRRFENFQSGDVITYYCSVHGRAVMSGIIAIR